MGTRCRDLMRGYSLAGTVEVLPSDSNSASLAAVKTKKCSNIGANVS